MDIKSLNSNPVAKAIGLGLVLLILVGAYANSRLDSTGFYSQPRLLSIEMYEVIDPRGGTIQFSYDRPIPRPLYKTRWVRVYDENDKLVQLRFDSSLSEDKTVETMTLADATAYNKVYRIEHTSLNDSPWWASLSAALPPKNFSFQTEFEKVAIDHLIPSERLTVSPEELNNQIGIRFTANVRDESVRRGINLNADEVPFIQMEPRAAGYYQWSDDRTLTFNFTSERPQYSTTYAFTVYPEKLVDSSYQSWVDERNSLALTTSTYEVYVAYSNLRKEASWNSQLRVEFSGNMVGALDLMKPKSPEIVPVEMAPAVKGTWHWSNAKTLVFTPDVDKGWPVRTIVEVKMLEALNAEPDRKWVDNKGLNAISFYVKPRVQSIQRYNLRGANVELEKDLKVSFSRAMVAPEQVGVPLALNRNVMNNPLHIDSAKIADIQKTANQVGQQADSDEADNIDWTRLKGKFYWASTDTLAFTPENLWPELSRVKVSLNPEYNPDPRFDWQGNNEFSFETVENLIETEFYFTPEDRLPGTAFFNRKNFYTAKNEGTYQTNERLWIQFNKDLGAKIPQGMNLSGAVEITPKTAGKFTWLAANLLEFLPEDNWQEQQQYQVTLNDKLFYHPEQHYRKDGAKLAFTSLKNEVTVEFEGSEIFGQELDSPLKVLEPDEPFTLHFSKNMDTLVKPGRRYTSDTVVADSLPLLLTPQSTYSFEWTGHRKLSVIPTEYWVPETKYSLQLNEKTLPQTQAKFSGGNQANIKTSKNILSRPDLTPRGTVAGNPEIQVLFNKNIRPRNLKDGDRDIDEMFTISPALSGHWKWTAPNRMIFKTSEEFADSTRYTIQFLAERVSDKQFFWAGKGYLDSAEVEPVRYEFNTPIVSVASSNARFEFDEKNVLKQRFFIDLRFTTPVKLADVEKNFTIWYSKYTDSGYVNVPLVYSLESEGTPEATTAIRVESDLIDRPAEDRRIHYKIASGITPVEGNMTMVSDFQRDFLQERPKQLGFTGVQWDYRDLRHVARVFLNSPVEPDKLKQFLKVKSYRGESIPYILSVDTSRSNDRSFAYSVEGDFKPGESIGFSLAPLLLATDGAYTNDTVNYSSSVPNLDSSLAFALPGNVLSRNDMKQVPINSTNVGAFTLKVERIFPNNIAYYLNNKNVNSSIDDVGKTIFKNTYKVNRLHGDNMYNQIARTHVDLSTLLEQDRHGLYQIHINSDRFRDRRWMLATDIGLIARKVQGKVIVWANSLSQLSSKSGATIELVDRWNQVIATRLTNQHGFAEIAFPNKEQPTLLIARAGDDFAFIDLVDQAESFSGEDVSGVSSREDILRSYIYSDRGVYRPGDVIHFVGVTRDRDGSYPTKNPISFVVKGATGQERVNEKFFLDEKGVYAYDYEIPAEAKTGKWSAEIKWAGRVIGNYKFQVEEFIPNKIKVKLEPGSTVATPGSTFLFDVQANNLFGPPAAKRKVSGKVSIRPSYFKPKGFSDYRFGHDDYQFQKIEQPLLETLLDDAGRHQYSYLIPEGIQSPIGVDLHYSSTVIDDSGRGVAEYASVPIHLYSRYLGVKRVGDGKINLESSPARFKIVNVSPVGEVIPRHQQNLKFRVYRKKTVTHFRKNERGYFRYVTEKIDVLVDELDDVRDSDDIIAYQPHSSGEHYLEAEDRVARQITRYPFQVSGQADNVLLAEAPEKVQIKLLSRDVAIGGKVDVQITTPFTGKLLLTGERDKVLFNKVYDLAQRQMVVSLDLVQGYYPNFYLSATVIRSVSSGGRGKPVYAKGLLNIDVDDESRKPELKLTVADKVSPNGPLKVDIVLPPGEAKDMLVTVAAVDVGILDLTKFKTPEMNAYFKSKYQLDVSHYSLYPFVMPYDDDIKVSISPSGGTPPRALVKKKRVNPLSQKRVKSVALWSGLVEFDARGKASVTLDVPDFDGQLRVMAVAFGDNQFNSTEKNVVVRDDLVMKPSLPRFLATGDSFSLPVKLFNDIGEDGDITVKVQSSSHVKVLGPSQKQLSIRQGSEADTQFSFRVEQQVGLAEFVLTAEGLGAVNRKIIQVPVRAPGNYVSLSNSGLVDAATPKVIQIPDAFRTGTENFAMKLNTSSLMEFSSSLGYLLRYPHGCLEQTTSKVFPLLYFEDFARDVGGKMFSANRSPRYFIQEGIKKIERMQLENGYYTYWEGTNNINHWSYVYASHFMVEAREAGFDINEDVWNMMIYRLTEDVRKTFNASNLYSGNYRLSHQVYVLYVLALANTNVLSELNYLHNNFYDKMKPHEKAMVAAAYKLLNQDSKARSLIGSSLGYSEYAEPYRETGNTFASSSRDLALLLNALVIVDPQADSISGIVTELRKKAGNGRWRSTQDNAFAFLALGKAVNKGAKTREGDIIVTLGDGTVVPYESALEFSTAELLAGDVSIETTQNAEVSYLWVADGISKNDVMPDEDSKIKVRRKFLDKDGKPVDLDKLEQGQLVVAEIEVSSLDGTLKNVVITDLLPGGLEIENARLSTSTTLDWLSPSLVADHVDIRDDRINIFLTLTEKGGTYYYTTRAVTAGSFSVPSIRAEAMYDESRYSVSGGGQLKISAME
ncbi:MAG: alpha-2-macroglobulin family protein [Desulfobacterales bacterium]|nr:alpha-2-macroglobulin family protein [Desulfobacterales bacterium]